MCEVITAKQIK